MENWRISADKRKTFWFQFIVVLQIVLCDPWHFCVVFFSTSFFFGVIFDSKQLIYQIENKKETVIHFSLLKEKKRKRKLKPKQKQNGSQQQICKWHLIKSMWWWNVQILCVWSKWTKSKAISYDRFYLLKVWSSVQIYNQINYGKASEQIHWENTFWFEPIESE